MINIYIATTYFVIIKPPINFILLDLSMTYSIIIELLYSRNIYEFRETVIKIRNYLFMMKN